METKNIKIKEAFDFLYVNSRYLTKNQSDFVAGLKRYYHKNKELTEKQQTVLFEIKKYLNVSDQQVRFSGAFVIKKTAIF